MLKPFPLARLKDALDKAKKQFLSEFTVDNTQEEQSSSINNNTDNIDPIESIKRLISKDGERMTILSPKDLFFITSSQGNCLAWDGEKNHYLSEKLDFLEQGLSSSDFVRIHRSYLINIDKVKEIQRWFNGKLMVIMNDEEKNRTQHQSCWC